MFSREILGVADPTPVSPWWYALATIALTFLGAVLKTFSDLVYRRNSFDEKFRDDMMGEMRGLREWNTKQQAALDSSLTRIQGLEGAVQGEQQLRHEIRNQLMKEQLEHQHTKDDLEHALHELERLKTENATLNRMLEKRGASVPPAPVRDSQPPDNNQGNGEQSEAEQSEGKQ